MWAMPFLPVSGGREVFTARLAGALQERGHDILVIAPEHSVHAAVDQDLAGSLQVVRLPVGALVESCAAGDTTLPTDLAVARTRLVEALDTFAPDLVHAHALGPDLALLGGQARERGIPVLVTDHGIAATRERAVLTVTQRMALIPAHVVAVSDVAARSLVEVVPGLAGRVSVVHNGVPLPARVTPVDPDRGHVLMIGRLSAEKGMAAALTAWAVLARNRAVPDLLVVGDGRDRVVLERLAETLGVADRVRFSGWLRQRDVAAAYDDACLVVVPSLWAEPFGLVAAEAGAHGRPVVASRVGALPEVVEEHVTGWLAQPGDIVGLVSTLNTALSDPAELARRGAAAARRTAESFGMPACTSRYEDVYRGLVP